MILRRSVIFWYVLLLADPSQVSRVFLSWSLEVGNVVEPLVVLGVGHGKMVFGVVDKTHTYHVFRAEEWVNDIIEMP